MLLEFRSFTILFARRLATSNVRNRSSTLECLTVGNVHFCPDDRDSWFRHQSFWLFFTRCRARIPAETVEYSDIFQRFYVIHIPWNRLIIQYLVQQIVNQ